MFAKMNSTFKIVSATVIAVLVLLFAFYLMGGDSSGFSLQQFIGIVVAAAVSGVITLLLLKGQSDTQKEMLSQQRNGEAARDKDVRIYANKIAAFSAFNKAVWTKELGDDEKAADNVENIRKELYGRAILYLNAEEVREIVKIVESAPKGKGKGSNFPVILSAIIDILNRNAGKNLLDSPDENTQGDDYKDVCQELWDKFNEWIGNYDQAEEVEEPVAEAGGDGAEKPSGSLRRGVQAWHFCELDTTQLRRLNEGFNELSLVEYQESWRTGLVQQVKKGDLVFLFRGAKKYAGVFRAKGWRVFKYDADRCVEEFTSEGVPHVLPQEGKNAIRDERVQAILQQYDIYASYGDDGSTSCANVVVERVSYRPEGVENPGGTYRKTISRYYEGYAVKLLERFRDIEEDAANIREIDTFFE